MPLLGGATSVLVVADALRAGPVRSSKTMSENVKQSEAVLRCRYCGHDTYEDVIKAAFWRGDGLIVIEGISARLCERCGEQFFRRTAHCCREHPGARMPALQSTVL